MLANVGVGFVKKIYLIRHMETVWNEEQKYIGVTDLPLSKNGFKNAHLLAQAFKDKPVKKVFSSQMLRAKQTASILAQQFNCPVVVQPLLNEINFGEWEGLTFNEIEAKYYQLSKVWLTNPFSIQIPGGESWASFTGRVKSGWEKVKKASLNETVVVTHAGCIKLILALELGLGLEKGWQIKQDKGAVNILSLSQDGKNKVLALNDTAYRQIALTEY